MTGITRWKASSPGRSRAVAAGGFLFLVANAHSAGASLEVQIDETFALIDDELREAGASRDRLVSVDVILADIDDKHEFDRAWTRWIGNDWPRRAVFGAALSPGLLIEITATAYIA